MRCSTRKGDEVFEGITRRSDHDRMRARTTISGNGRTACRTAAIASVYIVKPKMHGPARGSPSPIALFKRVEDLLGIDESHAQGRRDGRGAPDHGQPPRACVARREATVSSSSTPGSSIAPVMRFILRMQAGPMYCRRKQIKAPAVDRGLRRLERRRRYCAAGCLARRRSARACGPRPDEMRTDDGHEGRRTPMARRKLCVGAFTDSGDAARACIITPWMCPPVSRRLAKEPAPGEPR